MQSEQQHILQPAQLNGLAGQLAATTLKDAPSSKAGPPSLRPQRSQRFTVTANNNNSAPPPPVPTVSVPTVHAPDLDRALSNHSSLSVSSVSDDTESNSSAPTSGHPSYSGGTPLNPLAAPVQPFQNQSYHMVPPTSNAPYMTPPSSKGRAGSTGYSIASGARSAIPNQWMDPALQQGVITMPYPRPVTGNPLDDDDVIPTAIVVKNIPFSVRREQLLAIIDDLMIPPPYAFNYHFDNGVFRGLAFANFRSPGEADAAVAGLNGFDLSGRKLRVEYKKVLQAGEKERIEKEKAIKRMRSMQMQKEETFGVTGAGPTTYSRSREPSYNGEEDCGEVMTGGQYGVRNLGPPHSVMPVGWNSPAHPSTPLPNYVGEYSAGGVINHSPPAAPTASVTGSEKPSKDLDMNDPQTLEIYSRVLLFKDDPMRDELAFARSLSASQRRTVHQVAKKLGLEHKSDGFGDDRHVVVLKGSGGGGTTPSRSRQSTIGRSGGNSFLSPDAPHSSSGLRGKKSMPDMRGSNHSQHSGGHYYETNNTLGRRSNINLREGYATTGRRSSSGNPSSSSSSSNRTDAQTLFGSYPFVPAPPVPSLPGVAGVVDDRMIVASPSAGSALRQPKGPVESGKGFNESWRQARMGNGGGNTNSESITTTTTES